MWGPLAPNANKLMLTLAYDNPSVAIEAPAEIDAQFQHALRLIDLGQAEIAIPILEKLSFQTDAIRIRLELARAFFLGGRYKEARALFIEAFKADPPPVAKAHILYFLNQIDRRQGKLKLTASIARYENPLQQPGAYTLNFAGIELAYEPDGTYRNQWGVTVGGTYTKEIASGWLLSAGASYRELPGDAADRFAGDISVSRQLGKTPLEVKLGATRLDQKRQSFTLPYAQAAYAFPITNHLAVRPTVTIGYYAADAGQSASGLQVDAFVPLVFTPLPTKFAAMGPTVLRHSAGFGELAYTSVGLRAIGSFQTKTLNVEVGAQGTITRFDQHDPFWGVRRKDRSLFLAASVSSYRVRIGPFVPTIGFSCSVTGSSVGYYQQAGCDSQFEVRKIF